MPSFRCDLLVVAMYCASLLLLTFAYGVAVGRFEIFPRASAGFTTPGARPIPISSGITSGCRTGNLLIAESMLGKFEIDRNGRVVWEYVNLAVA